MDRDFRQMPPSRFRAGSEGEAAALVDWAEAYGVLHPGTFGGAWVGPEGTGSFAHASFTGDLERHREVLDPRIRLVTADRTATSLASLLDDVKAFGAATPAVRIAIAEAKAVRGTVTLVAETDDEPAFESALRSQFGDLVDLYFKQYGRKNRAIAEWSVDDVGSTITATWTGGRGDREWGLEADERDGEVHVTAWSVTEIGMRRAEGGRGSKIRWGSDRVGFPRQASVTLARPLGDRRVLDDQRDRMRDQPLVVRSDGCDLTQGVWQFVRGLDWAEIQGTEGPGRNGWIRVYAAVDDTERLRAALDERFGGGFEVVFKPRWQDKRDG